MNDLSLAGRVRKDILDATVAAGRTGAHIAPSLSLVEIVISILEIYDKSKDVFVLSKGHGALGYYAVMHQLKLISDEQFNSFEKNGGEFPGQPYKGENNGIQYSSGSLGMGLSYAVGRAWSNRNARLFAILGDGELNEGSVWEAAALAAKLHLNNITVIVDLNGMQSDGNCVDILDMKVEAIWTAFGWEINNCDGHSIEKIKEELCKTSDMPKVILAHTVKGKGISFMENNNEWHHHELNQEQYEAAVTEIYEKYGLS